MFQTGEKKIGLIATDLDGTLLDSGGVIPARNVSALKAAIARGIYVTIATGRMFASASRFAAEIGIDIPLICYNGAMVRRPDGDMLSHRPLDLEAARALLAIFKDRGTYVQAYIDDVLYVKDAGDTNFQNYLRHFRIDGCVIGDALYRPETPPTKLLAMTGGLEHSKRLADELHQRFGEQVYVTSSNADFVEMMNPLVDKGRSLALLAESLGVPMEQVMTLGDGENDVEMVSRAGCGIAMANARLRLKEAASVVGPTNDECGVAWAVEQFALRQ